MEDFGHKSVLLKEACEGLNIDPDGVYMDCTFGGGGHSEYILSHLKNGRLIAVDQDNDAIRFAGKRLERFSDKIVFVNDNFVNAAKIIAQNAPDGINGAIIDLGVSSYQLNTPSRGFSYHADAPLDMRMNTDSPFSAFDVVNGYSLERLAEIIRDYGEEKYAFRIASAICAKREEKNIETTAELAGIIKEAFPMKERFEGKHPARRTFQAIRIEVNHEIEIIPPTLDALVSSLKPKGRLSVITFHSLEDRAVKDTFKKYYDGCTCPRDFPVCVCGFVKTVFPVNKKPILPQEEELQNNPRSRSAKLRIIEKL